MNPIDQVMDGATGGDQLPAILCNAVASVNAAVGELQASTALLVEKAKQLAHHESLLGTAQDPGHVKLGMGFERLPDGTVNINGSADFAAGMTALEKTLLAADAALAEGMTQEDAVLAGLVSQAQAAADAARVTADAALEAAGQGFIAGGIVPFSGGFGGSDGKRPIPRGASVADESWVLCDGTGGTPDLRNRFIVGAGGKYAKDSKGGSETHSHSVSGSAGSATLSTSQMPSHNHAWYPGLAAVSGSGPALGGAGQVADLGTTSATGGSGSHSHSLSASAASANGLPPYYALSYIMKL